jgi:AraC-like DNA-binding protein
LNLFADNSPSVLPKEYPTEIFFKNPMKIEVLFSKIYLQYVLRTPASTFLIKTYLMQIFLLIFENLSEMNSSMEYKSNPGCRNINKIARHIEENIHLNFTLDELSQMSGYSRFTFCRQFKAIIGSTPVEFINNCKVQHARRLLLETDKSIKEISFDCGFDNESYFFILFRKLTGCSPLKYRKENQIW